MAIKRTCDVCNKIIYDVTVYDSHSQYYSLYKYKGESNEIRMDFCEDCFSKIIKMSEKDFPNLEHY